MKSFISLSFMLGLLCVVNLILYFLLVIDIKTAIYGIFIIILSSAIFDIQRRYSDYPVKKGGLFTVYLLSFIVGVYILKG